MTATLVTGICELVTNDETVSGADDSEGLGMLAQAAVVVEDGVVRWIGSGRAAPPADEVVDLGGRAVIPSFVDSHAHLMFAGDRATEFAARMTGVPYDGGGIATTVASCVACWPAVLPSCGRRARPPWRSRAAMA
jgi:imidazolonepropionase